MPRVTTASRRLLLLLFALACLSVPTSAAGQPSVSINPVISGTLGSNGWYVSNVNVSWQFDPRPDQTQGCDIRTITTDGLTHFVCTAWWGQVRVDYPLDIYIDKTPPAVHGVPGRQPDANGWYNASISVSFAGTDATSGVAGCSSTSYNGPDNRNASVSGTCTDNAGNVGSSTYGFAYDSTPPAVHGAPTRQPDANGWYNKPVSVSFAGTDATSGLAGCSSTSYNGPDNRNASVSGTCTDNAGNVGSAAVGFAYDSTPPTLGKVTVRHGKRSVVLTWTVSPDTQVTEITRLGGGAEGGAKVVYRGRAKAFRDKRLRVGAKYQYTVTAFDQASNAAASTLAVTATGSLINPVPGQRVTSQPRLAWLPVKGASYYNVQLWRGGRILSAWPRRANFKLPRRWVYHGHHYRLHPGIYRWYVWPGFGRLAQARFGRLLGGSSFVYAG